MHTPADRQASLNRRDLLRTAVAAGLASSLSPVSAEPENASPPRRDLIRTEKGDGIPGLVGWEWHGDPADIRGLEVVAQGQTFNGKNKGTYTATVYPGPKGNLVFNAATIWWSDGLSAPPGCQHPSVYGAKPRWPDARVQRITANLLKRFGGHG
jgi:hypothetical protein